MNGDSYENSIGHRHTNSYLHVNVDQDVFFINFWHFKTSKSEQFYSGKQQS